MPSHRVHPSKTVNSKGLHRVHPCWLYGHMSRHFFIPASQLCYLWGLQWLFKIVFTREPGNFKGKAHAHTLEIHTQTHEHEGTSKNHNPGAELGSEAHTDTRTCDSTFGIGMLLPTSHEQTGWQPGSCAVLGLCPRVFTGRWAWELGGANHTLIRAHEIALLALACFFQPRTSKRGDNQVVAQFWGSAHVFSQGVGPGNWKGRGTHWYALMR